MVERFNGRIAHILKTNRSNGAEDMVQTRIRYVALYNHHGPQSALKSTTPIQAMKLWYAFHVHLGRLKMVHATVGCKDFGTARRRITHSPKAMVISHMPTTTMSDSSPCSGLPVIR